jgi:hypothetical protein
MIVAAQGVGESLGHGRVVAFLPERHDHELSILGPAHVHQVTTLRIADEDGPALAGFDPSRGVSLGHARGDLGLGVERPSHALAKPLGSVISNRD